MKRPPQFGHYAPGRRDAIVHMVGALGPLLLGVWYWSEAAFVENLDWHVHLCWIEGYRQSLAAGVFYPRWIDTPNAGLGAPVFLLYPPFAHFVAAAIASLSDSSYGLKMVVTLATLTQFLGATAWFRLYVSPPTATLLGAAFCVAPAAIVPGYWFNMPAMAMGIAATTWVVAFLDPRYQPHTRSVLLLAVASGVLLLSHLPTALTAAPICLALLLGGVFVDRVAVLKRALALSIGTVLAAPYLLAAWLSMDLMHADYLHEGELWQIAHNLLPLSGDSQTRALGANTLWFQVSALAGLSVATLAMLIRGLKGGIQMRFVLLLAVFLFSTAAMFELAAPLYEAVPILQWLQFGWRWQAASMLLALGLLAMSLEGEWRAWRAGVAVSILVGLACLTAWGPGGGVRFWKVERVASASATEAARSCRWDTLEHRPRSMGESWQVASRQLPRSPQVLDGRVHWIGIKRTPHRRNYSLHVDFPATIRFDVLAFPGWEASINGASADYAVSDDGLAELRLGAGYQEVSFSYRAPALVRMGEWLALCLAALVLVLLVRSWRSDSRAR